MSSRSTRSTKACDIIVVKCGAGAKGFTTDECIQKMTENSVACTQCVVNLKDPCAIDGTEPSYQSVGHAPAKSYDLK
jgi:hypothetical protein